MPSTFENLWRTSRNLFPGVPALVVRQWAQDAYAKACSYHTWGFLRAEGFLATLASRSIAVTVAQGSTTVTSAGLFVASDEGRQFRVSTYPIYTIRTFTDVNTIVLDRAYQAADTAVTATILDAYAVMPADFGQFLQVWNPYEQRVIPWWFNQDQLAIADPARSISDSGPRYLIPYKLSGEASTLGQVMYEYHPSPSAARQYPYLYARMPEQLADTTLLPGLFLQHTEILKKGIACEAAQWPGTKDLPNPYFNLALYDRVKAEWDLLIQRLSLADDTQFPDQYMQVNWASLGGRGLTNNSTWLRQTDASVAEYW